MKPLYKYFEELATPANTIGMGNPMPATDSNIGSEPLCAKCKKEKTKKKRIKESIEEISNNQLIFTVIKPGFLDLTKQIIELFKKEGFEVYKVKTKRLLLREAYKLYYIHKDKDFYEDLCKYMISGPTTAIIYRKMDPTNTDIFKDVEIIKEEIRKKWGESDMRNVMHSSDSISHMQNEMGIYF